MLKEKVKRNLADMGMAGFFFAGMEYVFSRLYWGARLKRLGKYSWIHRGVTIQSPGNVSVGEDFKIYHKVFICVGKRGSIEIGSSGHIGVDSYLNAAEGKISIGDNVVIAPKTQIYSYSNACRDNSPISENHSVADVVIGDHVWIGAGAVILPGVRISRGAVVGAGAVVTKDVKENEIHAGVPARFIRKRVF